MAQDWMLGYTQAAAVVAALKREAGELAFDLVLELTVLGVPSSDVEVGRLAGYRSALGQ